MNPELAEEPPLSEAGRLTGVFFEPKKTFADLGARPRWLIPMVLATAAALAYMYAVSQRVGWERIVRKSMENSSRVQSLSPEQREQAVERGAKFGAVFGYVGAAAGTPLTIIVIAAVLLLTGKIMGANLNFAQLFAISSYTSLTGIIFVALAILVLFLKPPGDFDIQNPLAFNIGSFLDPQSTPKALYSLAGSLDLFSFWRILLLAAGMSAAAKGFPFGKALAAVLLPWALMAVLKMGWATAFG